MNWRRLLLVAHVAWLARRSPRDVDSRWDRFWAGVSATGDGGDVLWDASDPGEAGRYVDLLAAHADPARPVVDLGCGNGRFTRALATRFPRTVGVDASPQAIERARAESGPVSGPVSGSAGPEFRVVDLDAPGSGRALAAELGPCTAFVRGVLHALDPPSRIRFADNTADLVGAGGIVLVAETNHQGSLLGYLESLGGGPRGLPPPLARAIATGIPRPSRFGTAELDASFPADRWERVLVDDDTRIATVPMHVGERRYEGVPGYVALLRRR
jgi:SAM-dependent methyltransferase